MFLVGNNLIAHKHSIILVKFNNIQMPTRMNTNKLALSTNTNLSIISENRLFKDIITFFPIIVTYLGEISSLYWILHV